MKLSAGTPCVALVCALCAVLLGSLSPSLGAPDAATAFRLDGKAVPEKGIGVPPGDAKADAAKHSLRPLAVQVEIILTEQALGEYGIVIGEEELRQRVRAAIPELVDAPDQVVAREQRVFGSLTRGLRMAFESPEKEKEIYESVVKEPSGVSYAVWERLLRQIKSAQDPGKQLAAMEATVPSSVEDVYRQTIPAVRCRLMHDQLVDYLCAKRDFGRPSDNELHAMLPAHANATLSDGLRKQLQSRWLDAKRSDVYRKWLQQRFNRAKIEDLKPEWRESVRALRSYWWKE